MKPHSGETARLAKLLFASTIFVIWTAAALAQIVNGSYVTTTDVHIRTGPGTQYAVIPTIPKGTKVNVVGRDSGWLKVESKHGNKPGYVSEKYLRATETQQTAQLRAGTWSGAGAYRTLREIDLREGPGTKFKVVTRLPAGIKVNVVRAEGDWLRVESKKGGKPGYVESRAVEPWKER